MPWGPLIHGLIAPQGRLQFNPPSSSTRPLPTSAFDKRLRLTVSHCVYNLKGMSQAKPVQMPKMWPKTYSDPEDLDRLVRKLHYYPNVPKQLKKNYIINIYFVFIKYGNAQEKHALLLRNKSAHCPYDSRTNHQWSDLLRCPPTGDPDGC